MVGGAENRLDQERRGRYSEHRKGKARARAIRRRAFSFAQFAGTPATLVSTTFAVVAF